MICIDRHISSKDIINLLLKNRRIGSDKISEFLSQPLLTNFLPNLLVFPKNN